MAAITVRRLVYQAGKRAVDLMVAVPLAVATAPIVGAAALAIRVTMGPRVFFRQTRAGQDATPINIVKLRTMTNERDTDGKLLPDDQRLTRLGQFLRASSIDELPQLWNVVKGDLSLVGPRPLPLVYVARYNEQQRRRLDVKPGITGWAQVNGRNKIGWDEKFALDVWYVEHASLKCDLQILVRTAKTVFDTDTISAEGHATMPEFTTAA